MDAATLESVFGLRFVSSQDNWKGRCPFHLGNSSSFYVHKDDLIAHCFSCNVGGHVDELAAQFLHVPNEEARRRLAITGADKARRAIDRQHEVKEPTYIPESWLAPWKKEINGYVLRRGLSKGVLAGAKTLYDPALQRQVFPHRDLNGKLLGATGRSCVDQDPKWLHYWSYDKGRALYRPFKTNPLRPTLVVEGVFDLLWVYQHYDTSKINCVATLGVASTQQQLRELAASGTEVIVGTDNDEAGTGGGAHIYQSLRKTASISFIEWPEHSHDWMDLDEREVSEAIDSRVSAGRLALSGEHERLSCTCRRHTFEKERRLRRHQ